jgi:hypothetical protein
VHEQDLFETPIFQALARRASDPVERFRRDPLRAPLPASSPRSVTVSVPVRVPVRVPASVLPAAPLREVVEVVPPSLPAVARVSPLRVVRSDGSPGGARHRARGGRPVEVPLGSARAVARPGFERPGGRHRAARPVEPGLRGPEWPRNGA